MKDVREENETKKRIEQEKKNEHELLAWNEWKTVCKIFRCSDENRDALVERMWTSAQKKLDALLLSGNPDWAAENSDKDWGAEIGHAFDDYIRESETATGRKRVNYKDTIWKKIAEGEDNPLRLIRGKLTAPHRVLDNVLERFVVTHGLVVGVDNKHHSFVFSTRLNEKIGQGDAAVERIDLLPAILQPASVPREVREEWRIQFSEMFSYEDCAILLAHFRRVAFTEEAVAEACGVMNSRASEILKGKFVGDEQVQEGLLDKLACLHDEFKSLWRDYSQIAVLEMIVGILKKIVGMEKRGERLLSLVEGNEKKRMEKEMMKREKEWKRENGYEK